MRLRMKFGSLKDTKVYTTVPAVSLIFQMYSMNGKHYADLYVNKMSVCGDWVVSDFRAVFYVNSDNVGSHMSLDKTSLCNSEIWTFLTNKDVWRLMKTRATALQDMNSNNIIFNLIGALEKSIRRGLGSSTAT